MPTCSRASSTTGTMTRRSRSCACQAAMDDRGKLLMVERIIRSGNDPDPAKFSDLNMLIIPGGQERTTDDFELLYAEAEFRLTNIILTGSTFAIIEGTPT